MQQSHTYRIHTSQSTDQKCGKSVPAPSQEEFQNFFSPAFRKKLKYAISQPATDRQKSKRTTILKNQADSDFQTRWTRTPAANSVLPQLAVTCKNEAESSYQTFVQVDSVVLRNRQLRQHANRCMQA
jgi:hypothetical protein